jgi:hypothetical protein
MRERVSQDEWVRRRVEVLPGYLANELLSQHRNLVGTVGEQSTSPFFVANQWLVKQRAALLDDYIWEAFDEDMIRDHARNYARCCSDMPQLAQREAFALEHRIEPPPAKFMSDRYESRAARLADHLWWRRRLRAAWCRRAEEGMRRVGIVRKGRCPYASDSIVDLRRTQKRRMRAYCESHVARNELGEQLSLFDVQQGSIANPTLRRGEFMCRVRGFEELAAFRKDEALFFTATTPSHFHPQLAAGGANPKHDPRQTVRTAQQWLCQKWARFRAALHRRKVRAYGFRIAEPHHDGTPHWHGLLFCRPDDVAFVEEQLRKYWLQDFGDDLGAREHRVQTVRIDAAKGSAAGYIAKYVAKNIDGAGAIGSQESDESGVSVNDSVARVDAWASVHGIRQFQQFGGPAVGLWREARRPDVETYEASDVDIARCCRAADRGSWYHFCRSVTFDTGSRHSILKLWREETGEKSKYGECRPARVVGLRVCSARLITRPHRWRIERKGRGGIEVPTAPERAGSGSGSCSESPSDLGPVAITVRVIPGTRTFIQGRWWEMAFPGQPGNPVYVPAREISDRLLQ